MDFIFKGGTSLLLLLQKIYRLSVDIDIIVCRRSVL
ncbi:MAG: nucleotidyl transferase AbiEii/AbiGii toxin family protein [Clostridiales Family XIII bacterium]|nr:nucleotidyl transferase AbiEii/AbiGii toxin family protein [Clostridiales Family XIII bacterium]